MSPLLRWAFGLVSWILLTLARYICAVDPIPSNGPVPWILLPNGQPERCLGSYFQVGRLMHVARDVFEMVSLETMASCIVQRINTWDVTLCGKFLSQFLSTFGTYHSGMFYHITMPQPKERQQPRKCSYTAEMQQLQERQQPPKCSNCRNASNRGNAATAEMQQLKERQQPQECSNRRNDSNHRNAATTEIQQLQERQ
jgi:hypothetical protein